MSIYDEIITMVVTKHKTYRVDGTNKTNNMVHFNADNRYSFIFISITDERRPPYLAGNPPLINLVEWIASALKTEKKTK